MTSELLAVAPPVSWSQIEDLTIRVVKEYLPAVLTEPQPFPIEGLVRYDMSRLTGVVYCVVDDLPAHIEAVTKYVASRDRIEVRFADPTDLLLERGDYRARMTAAHEFAHVIQHKDLILKAGGSTTTPGLFRKKTEIPP